MDCKPLDEISEVSQIPSETNQSEFSLSEDDDEEEEQEEEEVLISNQHQVTNQNVQLVTPTVSLSGDLQMSLGGVSCLTQADMGQDIVVFSPDGNLLKIPSGHESIVNEMGEPPSKRICVEQDGQTFILTVQGGTNPMPVMDLSQVPVISATELLTSPSENIGETSGESDVNQAWFTSREDKSNLQNKGHLWRQGMWSKEEVELLEENIQKYCDDRNLTDPAKVIFHMTKDERKDFYRTVAKGLNRPLFSVYRRVIRMYDNKNHVGKYTQEELETLKKLRSDHGNDWQAIGAAMGRSASSIKDRCRLLKENCNQGKWLPTEERQLAEAVYELANVVPGEMISSGLSWAAVAERVGTRSEKQCRTKWLNYLNWKEAGGTEWSREDDITLICRVCSLNENDENAVDWGEIAKNWPSVRSPQWLRGKWWALKRHVPNSTTAIFPEVCDYLYQHYAQKIRISDDLSGVRTLVSAANVLPALNSRPIRISTPGEIRPILTNTFTTPTGFMQPIATALTTSTSTMTSVLGDMSSLISTAAPGHTLGVTPMIQTLSVIPQGIHLTTPGTANQVQQTFLLTHPPQNNIPMTGVAPGHIIIQALGDNLQMAEGLTLHLNSHPQIIINGHHGAPLTSVIQSQDLSLASTQNLVSSDCLDNDDEDELDEDDCTYVECYHDEDSSHHMVMTGVITEDDSLADSNKSNHLIMSDVMLTASRIPETMGSPDMDHHDKDSLDNIVTGSSES